MWGAIIGDIVGSRFEFRNSRMKEFELFDKGCKFTDDTVMSVAVADTLMTVALIDKKDFFQDKLLFRMRTLQTFHEYYEKFPYCGYGGRFRRWLANYELNPYGSYGNGSAMRVSPVGWLFQSLSETEEMAKMTADVSHNHPEGIKGAQSTAGAIFLARIGKSKDEIKKYIESYGYDLSLPVETWRRINKFDATCQGTIPVAIQCFLESDGFEDAIRNAVSVGGDSDTIAAITGSIAEAFYGIDPEIIAKARTYLHEDLDFMANTFANRYVHYRSAPQIMLRKTPPTSLLS